MTLTQVSVTRRQPKWHLNREKLPIDRKLPEPGRRSSSSYKLRVPHHAKRTAGSLGHRGSNVLLKRGSGMPATPATYGLLATAVAVSLLITQDWTSFFTAVVGLLVGLCVGVVPIRAAAYLILQSLSLPTRARGGFESVSGVRPATYLTAPAPYPALIRQRCSLSAASSYFSAS